jgi:serine/threonine protein phosphatase PrpC
MEVAVTTDVGSAQRFNDDAWCAEQLHKNVTLLAVADGFGRPHGVSAASVVIEAVRDHVRRELRRATSPSRSLTRNDLRELLVGAFADANDRLLRIGGGSDDYVGSGCTCSLVLIVSDEAFVAHIGDSRAYLLRRGELVQLTTDESIVTDFVPSGKSQHGSGHPTFAPPLLTRALGLEQAANTPPKITHYTLFDHDALLLCTDGACRGVAQTELHDYVNANDRPNLIAERIVSGARALGSSDNATVVFVRDATEHGTQKDNVGLQRNSRLQLAALLLAFGLFWTATLAAIAVHESDTHLYLGTDQSGAVTLYGGLPISVLGMPLHVVRGRLGIQSSTLSASARSQVDAGLPVTSVDEAYSIVNQWREHQQR